MCAKGGRDGHRATAEKNCMKEKKKNYINENLWSTIIYNLYFYYFRENLLYKIIVIIISFLRFFACMCCVFLFLKKK